MLVDPSVRSQIMHKSTAQSRPRAATTVSQYYAHHSASLLTATKVMAPSPHISHPPLIAFSLLIAVCHDTNRYMLTKFITKARHMIDAANGIPMESKVYVCSDDADVEVSVPVVRLSTNSWAMMMPIIATAIDVRIQARKVRSSATQF